MSYYYLISGLPNLSREMSLGKIDFEKIISAVRRNLTPEDQRSFRYLLYPNDNKNLLRAISANKDKSIMLPDFEPLSNIKLKNIEHHQVISESFPGYMQKFLTACIHQVDSLSARELEGRLTRAFMKDINELQDSFLTEYFGFMNNLKAIIQNINSSHFDFIPPSKNHSDQDISQLEKNKIPSNVLIQNYPFIPQLQESMATNDPGIIENFILNIVWDHLDNKNNDYNKEHVFKYTAKVLLLHRQSKLNIKAGLARFEQLKHKIKNDISHPKMATS